MNPPPRRSRRRLLLVLAACIALVLGLRALLPWALARGLGWAGREQLGISLQVANIDLGLLPGRVVLEGVRVGPSDGAAGAVSRMTADRLGADLGWMDLWSRRIRLENLEVEGLELQLARRPDGSLDLLVATEAEAEPPPDEGDAGPAWPLALDVLVVRDATLALVDATDARRLARVSFDDLELKATEVDAGRVRLTDVVLHVPRVEVERDFLLGGGAEAGEAPQAPEKEPAAAPAEEPVAVAKEEGSDAIPHRIEHLGIEDGTLVIDSPSGSFELGLELQARGVGALAGERFPVELDLNLGDGTLHFEGELGAEPIGLNGRLVWSDLPMPPLLLVSRPEVAAWLRSCHAFGDVELSLHTGEGAALEVRGTSRVDGLDVADPEGGEAELAWQSLQLEGIDLAFPLGAGASAQAGEAPARRVDLALVKLVAPRVHWVQPSPFAGTASEDETAAAAEPEGETPPTHVRVARFELEEGDVELLDRSVEPAYRGRLRDLRVRADAIRWPPAEVGSLELRSLAPETALLALDGGLGADAGELHLKLDRLALPPLDPYARGAGYVLEGGELTLEVDARRSREDFAADSELVLHGLDLEVLDAGDFQARFGVPPAMALALLRDPKGDIELSVPIRAGASGVRVGLGTIVRDAVRQALTGALTSPLKAAGFVLPRGGGGEAIGFEPLESPPGEPGLDAAGEDRLAGLAKLLKRRPALGLELTGGAGPADGPALVQAGNGGSGEELPDVAAEGAAVSEARLRELARSRAEGVRQALIERGVDPARLRVLEPTPAGPSGVVLELFAL